MNEASWVSEWTNQWNLKPRFPKHNTFQRMTFNNKMKIYFCENDNRRIFIQLLTLFSYPQTWTLPLRWSCGGSLPLFPHQVLSLPYCLPPSSMCLNAVSWTTTTNKSVLSILKKNKEPKSSHIDTLLVFDWLLKTFQPIIML